MNSVLNERFRKNLKEMRLAAGLSQDDFEIVANAHRTFISYIERGSRCSTLKTVDKFAVVFGIGPAMLLMEELPEEVISAAKEHQKEFKEKVIQVHNTW